MKMKKALSLCMALMLLILCCGCEKAPETAGEYVARMQEELTKTPCTKVELAMDMTVGMDMGPLGSFDMTMNTDTVSSVSEDPLGGYTEAAVLMEVAGQSETVTSTAYLVEENGEAITYTETAGTWIKVPTGQTMEQWRAALSDMQLDAANVAFAEDTGAYDAAQVVCLTTQIAGEELQDALDDVLNSLTATMGTTTNTAALDFSVLTCDLRIYVDKKTCLPVEQVMTVSGMDELMNQAFSNMAVTVEVKEYSAATKYLAFEKQQVPQLPEGAKEKAEVWTHLQAGENDNGDGTCTIGNGIALVNATVPEGFVLKENAYNQVKFRRDDYRTVEYALLATSEAAIAANMDELETYNRTHGATVSREQMLLTGEHFDFTCEIMGNQWTSYEEAQMAAWTLLGSDDTTEYWLLIQVNDGYNNGLGTVKSADITPEEFMTYLNGAVKSPLMD